MVELRKTSWRLKAEGEDEAMARELQQTDTKREFTIRGHHNTEKQNLKSKSKVRETATRHRYMLTRTPAQKSDPETLNDLTHSMETCTAWGPMIPKSRSHCI